MTDVMIAVAADVSGAAARGCRSCWRLARLFGLYAIVEERTCRVYVLFGKVVGMSRRAGAAFPAVRSSGLRAFVVNFLGKCYVLDMRLDQEYLRSQPVNSEEGAPMGIGIWYEMWISDPVSYLFKNTDPRGSLRANVSNATVRCLSNMPLAEMLRDAAPDEPDGARGSVGQIAGVGLSTGLGLYPQSAFSRCGDDQADRGEGGESAAAGDVGDQAGWRESGERHHQLGGAGGGGRVRQGGGDAAQR